MAIFTRVNCCKCDAAWKKQFEYYEEKNKSRRNGFLGEKPLLTNSETQKAIIEGIEGDGGFFASRFGENELGTICEVLKGQYRLNVRERRRRYYALCNNAGFFPNNSKSIEKYSELMIESMSKIDLHGAWPLYMEDYFRDLYFPNARCSYFGDFEPYGVEKGEKPWSSALKGKKVLVIHPFAELIEEQYANRRTELFSKCFENPDDILPLFKLETLKAVQTIAGNRDERFTTWFEALDWMSEECEKREFDVAIVGCGAYGFPLSAKIKQSGKKVIQLCGATQILFGIMGQRWNYIPGISNIKNEFWVIPGDREAVRNCNKIEGGCYW